MHLVNFKTSKLSSNYLKANWHKPRPQNSPDSFDFIGSLRTLNKRVTIPPKKEAHLSGAVCFGLNISS